MKYNDHQFYEYQEENKQHDSFLYNEYILKDGYPKNHLNHSLYKYVKDKQMY